MLPNYKERIESALLFLIIKKVWRREHNHSQKQIYTANIWYKGILKISYYAISQKFNGHTIQCHYGDQNNILSCKLVPALCKDEEETLFLFLT